MYEKSEPKINKKIHFNTMYVHAMSKRRAVSVCLLANDMFPLNLVIQIRLQLLTKANDVPCNFRILSVVTLRRRSSHLRHRSLWKVPKAAKAMPNSFACLQFRPLIMPFQPPCMFDVTISGAYLIVLDVETETEREWGWA